MENSFNIYCDESCHLLRDDKRAMVIGAIWCPSILSRKIADDIREIRQKHGLKKYSELKWRGVSNSKLDFYLDVIEYFNKTAALCFRAVIIPDKNLLDHSKFDQTHDDFYYKMYFQMLRAIICDPANKYRIFLDIKEYAGPDGLSTPRIQKMFCPGVEEPARATGVARCGLISRCAISATSLS